MLERQSAESRETNPAVLQSAAAEWTESETLLLLEAQERYGDSNWGRIAAHVRSKNELQCVVHFLQLPIDDVLLMDAMEVSSCPRAVQGALMPVVSVCVMPSPGGQVVSVIWGRASLLKGPPHLHCHGSQACLPLLVGQLAVTPACCIASAGPTHGSPSRHSSPYRRQQAFMNAL